MNTNIINDWSDDIETILNNIRINSNNLSDYHKEKYYYYKGLLKYFKIPIIILTSITSISSVGLQPYIKQQNISLLTCILSLFSALIGSIELYLGIQKSMDTELEASRSFLLLSYDIYKTLTLFRENRQKSGKSYLDEKYNEYTKLTEQANLIRNKHIKDTLTPIPQEFIINSRPNTPTGSEIGINLETFMNCV
jgi:hypothetical protein